MKNTCFLLAVILMVQQLPAQVPDGIHGFAAQNGDVSYAPLSLYTTGSGRLFPFHDGQMLQVGRSYAMIAIPDRGYAFSNWVQVVVFTDAEYTYDENGNLLPPIVSTIVSPGTEYSSQPLLKFTMQPVEAILDVSNVITITESTGWQANFVAVRKTVCERNSSPVSARLNLPLAK